LQDHSRRSKGETHIRRYLKRVGYIHSPLAFASQYGNRYAEVGTGKYGRNYKRNKGNDPRRMGSMDVSEPLDRESN